MPLVMMTSSNGNIYASLAPWAGNSPVTGEFPSPRPMTRGFDVFFDLHLNKRLGKQSWGWWFETPPCTLWRHCNVIQINIARVFWYLMRGSLHYRIFSTHGINYHTRVCWLLCALTTSHEKINGHRELTVSSRWTHGDHGGHGSGAQWSRLSHG